ncbi:hypothetical protein CUJ83_05505 [Methanocella sp. CWC-04]|uniref:Uncharacterized protein n=1 Tax=Methanooceanicella nereidis TaxID=2052831 RepID=A0AAP2RD47_9EURY|nr:hypothetical protein [Methanocella sp. CWC-04]MCD1294455.1 hypothetical protein [Methanocella sp. CWC-04]
MNKKTGTDSIQRKTELINKKVREINERRRGMKVTSIEDELDRQELRNYIRFLGVDQGTIRLESANGEMFRGNKIYTAILAVEGLIELLILFISASILLKPDITNNDLVTVILLMLLFFGIAYTMFSELRKK